MTLFLIWMTIANRRTFVVHVEDKPGVLNRIASLFRRRAFNIDSLNVGKSHVDGVSRMTIVVEADDDTASRFEANLYKLINVLRVEDITGSPAVMRVLTVIKVRVGADRRSDVLQVCDIFRAHVIDASADSLILEATGTRDKIDALVAALGPFEIVEAIHTGAIAMTRGPALASMAAPVTPAAMAS